MLTIFKVSIFSTCVLHVMLQPLPPGSNQKHRADTQQLDTAMLLSLWASNSTFTEAWPEKSSTVMYIRLTQVRLLSNNIFLIK